MEASWPPSAHNLSCKRLLPRKQQSLHRPMHTAQAAAHHHHKAKGTTHRPRQHAQSPPKHSRHPQARPLFPSRRLATFNPPDNTRLLTTAPPRQKHKPTPYLAPRNAAGGAQIAHPKASTRSWAQRSGTLADEQPQARTSTTNWAWSRGIGVRIA